MFKKTLYIILSLSLFSSTVYGQRGKKKQKNNYVKEYYHNITARYNGYFNAKMKLKEVIEATNQEVKDDYSQILGIFPAQDKMDPTTVGKDMDLIIEKTTKVIQKHPGSKWVDDCFYLMGQAHFYKQEYEDAIKSYIYISSSYKPDELKKNKGKKPKNRKQHKIRNAKPEEDWKTKVEKQILHQPIYYKSLIALIHTYVAMSEFSKAETVINLIKNNDNFPEDYKRELLLTEAHTHIKNQRFEKAITPLHEAIKMTEKKSDKPRLLFIEGQLLGEVKQSEQAIRRFNQLLSLNPDYDLAFNTKLKLADIYLKADMPLTKVKQMLLEMIRNEKNADQLDVLYYRLAEIEKNDFNSDKALNHLNISLKKGDKNKEQKGLSYIMAGDIYFSLESYRSAAAYYDSSLAFLDKENVTFKDISFKAKTLNNLVIYLDVIAYQDSMQLLASLSKDELDALIDELIEERLIALEEAREAEDSEDQSTETISKGPSMPSMGREWYFYNEQAKRSGYDAFVAKWGKRKLEDHWRRSDKSSEFTEGDSMDNESELSSEEEAIMERTQYMTDIPFDDDAMVKSDKAIAEALFKTGSIYFNELSNVPLALNAFNRLINKHKDHEYLAQTYYHLHLIYKRKKNKRQSNYYKQALLREFPEHELSKLLQRKQSGSADLKKLKARYEQLFELFQSEQHMDVISQIDDILNEYPSNKLEANYLLLRSISYGKIDSNLKMVIGLESLVKNFKGTDESLKAQKLLDLINNNPDAIRNKKSAGLFINAPDETHYFVILLHKDIYKTSNISVKIANFNEDQYKRKNYSVSNLQFDNNYKMVVVKGFDNSRESLAYFKNIQLKNTIEKGMVQKEHMFFIAQKNFTKLLKDKNIKDYADFFANNYLKNIKG